MRKRLTGRLEAQSSESYERQLVRVINMALFLLSAAAVMWLLALFIASGLGTVLGAVGLVLVLAGGALLLARPRRFAPRREIFLPGEHSSAAPGPEPIAEAPVPPPAFHESSILEIAHAIAEAGNLEEIIRALQSSLLRQADYIALVTCDAGTGLTPEIVAVWDRDNLARHAACPPQLAIWASRQPLVVDRLSQLGDATQDLREYMENQLYADSLCAFPLRHDETLQGFLIVAHRQAHRYEDVALQQLHALGGHITARLAALDEIGLLRRLIESSSALYASSLALNKAQCLGDIYEALMTDVGRVTQASALAFYIAGPDPNREVAYLDHVARWQDDEVEILTEPARFSLDAAPVLSQFPHVRAPLVLRDILSDSQLPEDLRKEFAARNVTSLLLLPVTAGSVWLGTVIGEKSRPGGFDDEAVRLASSIAEQTGMALNLQLMLEHNRQTALRERVIRQIIDRIRVSTDPDEVTAIADQSLSELLSVPVETIHEARLGNRNLLSPEDWQIIRDIDHQAQLTISNLFLLERTQRTVMTEQVVSDITAELQRTSDVDEVLETTVRALRAALADYDISLRLEPGLVDSRGADSDGDH